MAEDKSKPKENTSANTTTEQRATKKELGTVAIQAVKNIVSVIKPYELSPTNRLHTYQMMMLDDAVYNCFDSTAVLIEKAFMNYEVECDINSKKSVEAKKFLQWNLNNLAGKQSVGNISRSAAEFIRDGMAPFEKVFERGSGEYENTPDGRRAYKLKKLNYIHPLTLQQPEPFTIINGGRTISEMRQRTNATINSQSAKLNQKHRSKGYIPIPMNKVALATYSATDAQPFGRSTFDACYTAWREKVLFQDLTAVGVSKDLAGTPILQIPASILNKAANDPTSDEAKMVESLKESLANLHAGDQASMIMPSDTFGESGTSTVKEFEIKFLGVQGNGKNFDMEALVEQRRKFIYNVFGASHLIASDSSGGYNQLEGQVAIHKHYVDRDIAVIEEMWNRDIIPQLFRLNEWDLSYEELPKIKAGNITPNTIEEFTKGVQRVGAVGFLPRTPQVVNEVMKGMGIKYQVDETMSVEELGEILSDMTTRSGDGLATPHEGTRTSAGKGNSSDTNSDNTA